MTCKAIGLGTKNRNLCCYVSVHQMTTGLHGLDMTMKEANVIPGNVSTIQQSCSWIILHGLPFFGVILVIICDGSCSLKTELPGFPSLNLHILPTLSQEAQDIPKIHWAAPSPRTGNRYFHNPVIKSLLQWILFSIILSLGAKTSSHYRHTHTEAMFQAPSVIVLSPWRPSSGTVKCVHEQPALGEISLGSVDALQSASTTLLWSRQLFCCDWSTLIPFLIFVNVLVLL